MHIIIEGLDRSGKSTLAQLLSDQYGFPIVHCAKPKGDPFKEYLELFKKYDGEDVIFDRFYHGEFVYSELYRDGCTIDDFQLHQLDMLAMANSTLLIYATADNDTITARCKATNESLEAFNYLDDIPKAKHLYKDVFSRSYLNYFLYDSSKCTAEEFVRPFKFEITLAWETSLVRRRLKLIDARSTGALVNSTVLIGEQLRPGASIDETPFFSGTSSQYLFKCLHQSNLFKRSIYLTNAFKPWLRTEEMQAEVLALELKLIRPHTIIFLGNRSAEFAKQYNVVPNDTAIIVLPHPSYWKRFHYHESETYINLLNQGAYHGQQIT